jgi:aldose 1-epimerase
MPGQIQQSPFGVLPDGRGIDLYTLTNANGLQCKIMTYGGTMTGLLAPDRHGKMANIILSYPRLEDYLEGKARCGALIGRVANRIRRASFMLDGKEVRLAANDGLNHLHGGWHGFDKQIWQAQPSCGGLELNYTSPDNEEGYPGTLEVTAAYTLTDANELRLSFLATTDRPTPANLTSHPYWNLAGAGNIFRHELTIAADYYTPVDEEHLPTGEIRAVAGTPFDFKTPATIGGRLEQVSGFNQNYVLANANAARLYEPDSGRMMELWTEQPGLQFYSGTFLDGPHRPFAGLCLEAQIFPDAVNHGNFPNCILRPGQMYRHETVCRFSTV